MTPEMRVGLSLARDGIALPVAVAKAPVQKGPTKAERKARRVAEIQRRKEWAAINAIRTTPAHILQQWGHTMREIAIIRGVNLDDIKRSLYWEKLK